MQHSTCINIYWDGSTLIPFRLFNQYHKSHTHTHTHTHTQRGTEGEEPGILPGIVGNEDSWSKTHETIQFAQKIHRHLSNSFRSLPALLGREVRSDPAGSEFLLGSLKTSIPGTTPSRSFQTLPALLRRDPRSDPAGSGF